MLQPHYKWITDALQGGTGNTVESGLWSPARTSGSMPCWGSLMPSTFRMLLSLLLFCAIAVGDEPAAKPTPEEINSLIAQLKSPNKAPNDAPPWAEYSKDYDHDAQKKVRAAFDRLHDIGRTAFSYLVEHFNDDAYSYTYDQGNLDKNFTVGEQCRLIFELELVPWSGHRETSHKDDIGVCFHWPHFVYLETHHLYDPKTAKKWCEERKDKLLHDLQVEVLEGTIDEEEKAPNVYPEIERNSLKVNLVFLQASKEPLKPQWELFAK